MFDINPLSLLNQREMKFLPDHFSKIKLAEVDFYKDEIINWVRSNLNGRFFIGKTPTVENNNLKSIVIIAFENKRADIFHVSMSTF